ncbi:MAG: ABC transporter permease [Actinobacteria bacterium]|nr:MAG: ABC transporter permease [Actinomycetota bacterium]
MDRPRPEPVRVARLAWLFFRVGAMNELQYRVNFVLQIFHSFLALGVGLAVLGLVFSHTTALRGWTRPELLAVMGVHILMGGLIGVSIQPNMSRLMEDVRQGTLDYALTKPEDAQVLVSVREVRIWKVVDVLIGAILLAVAVVQLQRGVGFWDAFAFAVALVLGGLIIYSFWLALACLAFWVVRIWETVELFEGVYQAGRWPVGIYPGWLRIGLTFLVPLAFAITVPARAVTSRLGASSLLAAAIFTVVILALARWLWTVGLHRYSGASA